MVFASLTFLYWFLPVVVLLYVLVPKRCKNVVLLLASLVFFGWGAVKTLPLLGASILIAYGVGLGMDMCHKRARSKQRKSKMAKCLLFLGIGLELAALFYFKYADFFIENINRFTGLQLSLLHVMLPVGISFYTFQMISYMADVYCRKQPPQKNLIDFAMYICLFTQLVAGPIIRYTDMAGQLKTHKTSWEDAAAGLQRILIGLSKKVLLADIFGEFGQKMQETSSPSVILLWLGAIAFALQLYFDFSGYSDMAVGLGRLFGFRFPENFRYPYCADSIQDFWRRWHISLGTWFRDYVYIPLGGSRCSKWKWIRNVFVVWLLTGFWHGAEWNFIVWGLVFAILLILERKIKLPRILVLLLVVLNFVVFQETDLSVAVFRLGGMFGLGGLPLCSEEGWYLLKSYGILFLLGGIGATPLCRQCTEKIRSYKWGGILLRMAEPVVYTGLLILSTAYLVDDSYHPFLYFRF